METVTVSRRIEADPAAIESVLSDVGPFTAAGGFDEVTVEDDLVHVENRVGLATLELTLAVVEADAALALEQREGLFREMRTRYEVEPTGDATRVTATTEFALGGSVVGELLDATVIRRQRTKELESQLDYVQDRTESQ